MVERKSTEAPNDVLVAFRTALARARHNQGEIELVTFAYDSRSGFKRAYSSLRPMRPEAKLNEALTDIISEIVPEGESRETLEKGFAEDPDHKGKGGASMEWQITMFDNVAIGVRTTLKNGKEVARSWYFRNTSRDKKIL